MTFRIRSRRCKIVDLSSLFGPNYLAESTVRGRMEWSASARRGKRGRYIVRRREDRLQLARRARYDTQHLRGRGLLLQRLGQFACALLHLIEQPHVLDCD